MLLNMTAWQRSIQNSSEKLKKLTEITLIQYCAFAKLERHSAPGVGHDNPRPIGFGGLEGAGDDGLQTLGDVHAGGDILAHTQEQGKFVQPFFEGAAHLFKGLRQLSHFVIACGADAGIQTALGDLSGDFGEGDDGLGDASSLANEVIAVSGEGEEKKDG